MKNSVKEIVDDIITTLNPEDVHYITNMSLEKMQALHHSTGRSIRNEYKLWDENNPLTKQWFLDCKESELTGTPHQHMKEGIDWHPNHPDSVSNDVLTLLWKELNEKH